MYLLVFVIFTLSLSAAKDIDGELLELILHCSQPWSQELEELCPEACRRWPQYCYYAIAAENGVPGTCQLPPYPRIGSYSIVDVELSVGLADFTLLYSCPSGYRLNGQHPRCVGGGWTSDDFPSCKRDSKCRLPSHPSVTYNCIDSSQSRCSNFVSSGQRVLPECRPGFVQDVLRAMHCIDGSWDYVATCRRECGTIPKEMRLRRSVSEVSEVPWHASVYDKTVTPFRQICGGSLISATVIVSAAHCFWRDLVQPAENYAVAVGKVYRPWWRDGGQKTDVSGIKVSPYFRGIDNNFQSDIALVTLRTAMVFNNQVRPVCLDFSVTFDEKQLQPGNVGKVAAWNKTPLLKFVELPYVDVEQCFADLPRSFLSFITSDKICAGTRNSTKLCNGDSGGGLVFPRTEHGMERWYLRGVVSTAPQNPNTYSQDICDAGSYTAFTHLLKHDAFVTKVLEARSDYVNQVYFVP
ncbi:modular serine protease-like isoform X2 [Cydia pomonella]|uniref:modular serine protease-like isoform X2 n=1 Tax=Cydia pomonella TaxID=82600 RepID=UPI002ADE577C|nr:modular serine protease-like isoform X2 [Cydia pomonella]